MHIYAQEHCCSWFSELVSGTEHAQREEPPSMIGWAAGARACFWKALVHQLWVVSNQLLIMRAHVLMDCCVNVD
jgi:hypothetical protein